MSGHIHPDLGWIENRLSPSEKKRALAHWATCALCHAEAHELTDTADALAAMPNALTPLTYQIEGLWPAIWERVQQRVSRLHPAWQLGLSASMVAVLLTFSGLRLSPMDTGRIAFTGHEPALHMAMETPLPAAPTVARQHRLDAIRSVSTMIPVPAPTPYPFSAGDGT